MNKPSAQTLAKKGRGGDTQLGHLTPGEVVLPRSVMNSVPGLSGLIAHAFSMSDMDMKSYKVGDDDNNINPTTGLPEYASEDSAGDGTESQGGGGSYNSNEDDDPGGNQGRDTPSRDFNVGAGSSLDKLNETFVGDPKSSEYGVTPTERAYFGNNYTKDGGYQGGGFYTYDKPEALTTKARFSYNDGFGKPTESFGGVNIFGVGVGERINPVTLEKQYALTFNPGSALGSLAGLAPVPGAGLVGNYVGGKLADTRYADFADPRGPGFTSDMGMGPSGSSIGRGEKPSSPSGNRLEGGGGGGLSGMLSERLGSIGSGSSDIAPTAPPKGPTAPSYGSRLPPQFTPYTEEQLGKGVYDYFYPDRVTYPGNTPYTSPEGYASGGLAGMFGGTVLPAAVGFGSSMLGLGPFAGAGLAGLTGYAMGGRNRSILDGVKGALAGYAGGSLADVGGVAGVYDVTGSVPVPPATGAATVTGKVPVANTMVKPPTTGFGDVMSTAGTNIANNFNANGMKNFALPLGALGGSLMLPSGRDSTAGSEGPAFASGNPPTFKNEEERQAFLAKRRANSTSYTPFTDDQLGTNPDWYNSYSNPQPGYADGGRVADLEKGSFVIPADVVSDAGDGNTEAGFEKLDKLLGKDGGKNDEKVKNILEDMFKLKRHDKPTQRKAMGGAIKGSTGGLDDLRQTTVEGSQAAAVSDGEYVVPRGDVARIGDGSVSDGSEKLYNFLKQIRMQKHGTNQQPPNTITMQGLRSMLG